MNVHRAFHVLTAALILTGISALEVGAGESMFVVGTVAVCVLYVLNETGSRPRYLPTWIASAASMVAFLVTALLAFGTPEDVIADVLQFRVPLIGRFLIVTQWALMLRRRTNRDYTWLYLMSLTELAGGALLMPELTFAVFYALFVALAVGALFLFTVKQELEAIGRSLPTDRKVGVGFGLKCGGGSMVFMLPVALCFSLLPRGRPGALGHTSRRSTRPVTGFAEAVQLGDMARIQQSASRVMQVAVLDSAGKRLQPPKLLMRGASFDSYDGRRWKATPVRGTRLHGLVRGEEVDIGHLMPEMKYPRNEDAPTVRCEVTLEPLDSRAIFAPFAISTLSLPFRTPITLDTFHHTVHTQYERRGVLQYRTTSRLIGRTPPPRKAVTRRPNRGDLYLQLPPQFPQRVRTLAERVCRVAEKPSIHECAQRIDRYLSDPQRFAYSLDLRPTRGHGDPVEDFLFNTREGNCEYFASAMVLMLRCVGIRARLVNGFAGGEWNEFGRYVTFRHRDAHSWVEAHVPLVGWASFDPSPTRVSGEIRRTSSALDHLRSLFDFIDRAWIEYVVSYGQDEQSGLYRNLRKPALVVKHVLVYVLWHVIGEEWLVGGLQEDLWQTVWRRTRTLFIAVAAAVLALALGSVVARRWRRAGRPRGSHAGVAFYNDLLHLLRRRGFQRPAHLTPAEFAARVMAGDRERFAAVGQITRQFYRVRYGGRELTQDEHREIRNALSDLKVATRRRNRPKTRNGHRAHPRRLQRR